MMHFIHIYALFLLVKLNTSIFLTYNQCFCYYEKVCTRTDAFNFYILSDSYCMKYAHGIINVYNLSWGMFYMLVHYAILIVSTSRSLKSLQRTKFYVCVIYTPGGLIINKCTGAFYYEKHQCMYGLP